MTKTFKKSALAQTTEEYASRSSIHGIGYIFDRELNIVDRLLWLLVVLAFLGIAAAISWDFWSQWRDEQVRKKPLNAIEYFGNDTILDWGSTWHSTTWCHLIPSGTT